MEEEEMTRPRPGGLPSHMSSLIGPVAPILLLLHVIVGCGRSATLPESARSEIVDLAVAKPEALRADIKQLYRVQGWLDKMYSSEGGPVRFSVVLERGVVPPRATLCGDRVYLAYDSGSQLGRYGILGFKADTDVLGTCYWMYPGPLMSPPQGERLYRVCVVGTIEVHEKTSPEPRAELWMQPLVVEFLWAGLSEPGWVAKKKLKELCPEESALVALAEATIPPRRTGLMPWDLKGVEERILARDDPRKRAEGLKYLLFTYLNLGGSREAERCVRHLLTATTQGKRIKNLSVECLLYLQTFLARVRGDMDAARRSRQVLVTRSPGSVWVQLAAELGPLDR